MKRAYRGSGGNKGTQGKRGMEPGFMCSGGCKAIRKEECRFWAARATQSSCLWPQVWLPGHVRFFSLGTGFWVPAEGVLCRLLGMPTAESRAPGGWLS